MLRICRRCEWSWLKYLSPLWTSVPELRIKKQWSRSTCVKFIFSMKCFCGLGHQDLETQGSNGVQSEVRVFSVSQLCLPALCGWEDHSCIWFHGERSQSLHLLIFSFPVHCFQQGRWAGSCPISCLLLVIRVAKLEQEFPGVACWLWDSTGIEEMSWEQSFKENWSRCTGGPTTWL